MDNPGVLTRDDEAVDSKTPSTINNIIVEQENLPKENNDDSDDDDTLNSQTHYRQWLHDRTNGTWRSPILDDDEAQENNDQQQNRKKWRNKKNKPPCFACYVPKPVLWLAPYIEMNPIFERLGKVGYFPPDNQKARNWCIGLGLASNVAGLFCLVWSMLALTTQHYRLLELASFNLGYVNIEPILNFRPNPKDSNPEPQFIFNDPDYAVNIGLKGIGLRLFENAPGFGLLESQVRQQFKEIILPFDEFCQVDHLFGLGQTDEDVCQDCHNAGATITISLCMSLFFYFPNLTTDVLRLYPNYDCNCQKVFASFAAVISIAMAIQTWLVYQFACFRQFRLGKYCLMQEEDYYSAATSWTNTTLVLVPCDSLQAEFSVDYYYSSGPGLNCLGASAFLKVLDMVMNLLVPSPTICRDREEQKRYEYFVLNAGHEEKEEQAQDLDGSNHDAANDNAVIMGEEDSIGNDIVVMA